MAGDLTTLCVFGAISTGYEWMCSACEEEDDGFRQGAGGCAVRCRGWHGRGRGPDESEEREVI
jgi:hypothetical protein